MDLAKGKVRDYKIPEKWVRKHLGGRGLGARVLLKELRVGIDPLGSKNILVFATGPFQGTGIAGSGQYVVMAKSPKTRSVSGSYAGGFFGYELGTSGYDGIIIRNKADAPKYVSLMEGEAEVRDADNLWGLTTGETEEKLKKIHEDGRVASIGPAGERLVKFACIISDRSRAVGRPGFGAVMGSKKLKAVIVKGGLKKPVYDEGRLAELRSNFARDLKDNASIRRFGKYGTSSGVLIYNNLGILPTKNFKRGVFDGAEKISGERMYHEILVGRKNCVGCPIRCKRVVKTEFNGERVDEKYGGPEYETIAAFGSLCFNDNLKSIALANQKCNEYGLDTISTGNIIAFAIEATERGLIESELEWGNPTKIINAIKQIAAREEIGGFLAKGINHVSKKIGADFAVQVKGQEVPLQEPRGKTGLALSYATNPRGANHQELLHDSDITNSPPELGIDEPIDRFDWKIKPKFCIVYENLTSFTNSLILCAFTSWCTLAHGAYPYPVIREILNAITGLNIGSNEMLLIGDRNYCLLKILAAREGFSRKDDDLPSRLKVPLSEGASANKPISEEVLQEMIDKYYKIRGFDRYGPTNEKLEEIGLEELKGIIQR